MGHLIRFGLALAFLFTASIPVFGHSFYDGECCSDNDCAPVKTDVESDFTNKVYRWDNWVVPFNDPRIRHSPDGQFHACILPYTKKLQCLYIPHGGV